MTELFILLVMFQIKHFLADYILQGKYMLGKFKEEGWELPLAAHCMVHVVFTFSIVMLFTFNLKSAIGLSILDFVAHFIMDRIKAAPDLLGQFKPLTAEDMKLCIESGDTRSIKNNTLFWWCLGLDQTVHHLTHYLIIYLMVT